MRGILAFAACSIIAASAACAQTAPTQPGQHGLFDSAPYPPDASGLVTLGDLDSKLGTYATTSALTAESTRAKGAEATLQGNINAEATTRANADSALLSLSGGTMTGALYSPNIYAGSTLAIGAWTAPGNASLYFRNGGDSSNSARILVTGGTAGTTDSGAMQIRAASIYMTGTPTIGATAAAGDNTTAVATTAGVRREIATGYTVATLPTDARRYTGARAYVTDATSCAFLGSLTGGGSTFCPVVYSGTAWVAE